MKKTSEYKYLERRIKLLEKHFDFRQDPSGLTQLQEDKIKGFCLLCHAELEDYFESIARRIFQQSADAWKKNKTANFQLASFFIQADKIDTRADSFSKSFQMILAYENVIKNNHGIKGDNILKLYKPLGYELDDFDPMLISELDEFGKRRGESAHTSKKHTTIVLDKKTEFDRVNRILLLLMDFEAVIRSKYGKL